MAEETAEIEEKEPPKKRGPGRPKGLPKTGGRQKAVRNWTNPEIRNELLNRSNAIEALASIAAGEKQRWAGPTGKQQSRYPTAQEQLQALGIILQKTVPNLQATELTGKDGEPLLAPPPADARHTARAVLAMLRSVEVDEGETDSSVVPIRPDSTVAAVNASLSKDDPEEGQEGPSPSEILFPVGHMIDLGDAGSIQLVKREGDREQWRARYASGAVLEVVWGRDEAEQACRDALAKQQREDQESMQYIEAREERSSNRDPFKGRAQHWKNLRGTP